MLKREIVGYIYKITNKITGEVYIGQTYKDYEKRWNAHKNDAKQGKKKTKLVQSFVKYDIDNFEFEMIEEVIGYSGYLLDIKETEYIRQYDSYNNGLNSNEGGNRNGYSEIQYVAIIVDKFLEVFSNVEDKVSFNVNSKEDAWLYKAMLFLDNSPTLVSKYNLKIGFNKYWEDIDVTVYNRNNSTISRFEDTIKKTTHIVFTDI